MSKTSSNAPSPQVLTDFTDLMIMISRFKMIEKIHFMTKKLSTLSTAIVGTVKDSPSALTRLSSEEDDVTKISFYADSVYNQARSNLSSSLPKMFGKDNELTDLAEDLLLFSLLISEGRVSSIMETFMLLYSVTVKDFYTEEEAEQAAAFLAHPMLVFSSKFFTVEPDADKIDLTDEAKERIEARVTEIQQSGRSFAVNIPDPMAGRTVH